MLAAVGPGADDGPQQQQAAGLLADVVEELVPEKGETGARELREKSLWAKL